MDKLRAREAVGLAMRENMLGWIWEYFLLENEYLMQSPSWLWLQRPLTRQPVENESTVQASFVDAIKHWANLIGAALKVQCCDWPIGLSIMNLTAHSTTHSFISLFSFHLSLVGFARYVIETFSVQRLLNFFKNPLYFKISLLYC